MSASKEWNESDFVAKAYGWMRENVRLVDRADDQAESLVALLREAHSAGRAKGVKAEREENFRKECVMRENKAASHASNCYSGTCLGQCRHR